MFQEADTLARENERLRRRIVELERSRAWWRDRCRGMEGSPWVYLPWKGFVS